MSSEIKVEDNTTTEKKSKFEFETVKEITFFQDNWKRFTISYSLTKWSTGVKPNIVISRFYPDKDTADPKLAGRVLFPLNVWSFLVQNIGALANALHNEVEGL